MMMRMMIILLHSIMSVTPCRRPATKKHVQSFDSSLRVSRWLRMSSRRPFAKLQAATAVNGILEKMSKSEIQSWAQHVDGDEHEGPRFDWESLDEKWDEFLKYAQLQVTSGKTKARTVFLQERLLPLVARAGVWHKLDAQAATADKCTQDLDLARNVDIFKLLILTYPRYIDSASRDAVVRVLKTMIQRDEERGTSSGELKAVNIGLCC